MFWSVDEIFDELLVSERMQIYSFLNANDGKERFCSIFCSR